MTKVWVVQLEMNDEGKCIIDILATEELAGELIRAVYDDYYGELEVEDWEITEVPYWGTSNE